METMHASITRLQLPTSVYISKGDALSSFYTINSLNLIHLHYSNTPKRQQRAATNIVPPPNLELDGRALNENTATAAIGGRLDEIEREAKLQRTVMYDFAASVDKFVSSYRDPDQKAAAHELCNKVVSFLTTSLYAETNGTNYAPIRIKSRISEQTSSKTTSKSVSFADMAKTLKNSGADFRSTQTHSTSASGAPISVACQGARQT
jgi:hypothetical protein